MYGEEGNAILRYPLTAKCLHSTNLRHDGGVEVGVGEVLLDAGPEPPHGGGVGDVGGLCLASAAGKKAADATKPVDDDGSGVTGG